jgi:hypothetical protein
LIYLLKILNKYSYQQFYLYKVGYFTQLIAISGVARKKEPVSRGSGEQQPPPPEAGDVFLQRMAKIHVW